MDVQNARVDGGDAGVCIDTTQEDCPAAVRIEPAAAADDISSGDIASDGVESEVVAVVIDSAGESEQS